jgi:Alginate export
MSKHYGANRRMNRKQILFLFSVLFLVASPRLRAQQESLPSAPTAIGQSEPAAPQSAPLNLNFAGRRSPSVDSLAIGASLSNPGAAAVSATHKQQTDPKSDASLKVGALTIFGSWRFRTEAWDWFEPSSGQNAYAFGHSLLRLAIGQKRESFEWLLEGAQDAIVDLPTRAVVSGTQGQLGLGGTYFAANGNNENNVNGFVKQAYVAFALPASAKLKLGRFTFLDGEEYAPKDKTLATIVRTRIAQRLIGDFGFSAVQRSFDGVDLSFHTSPGNITLFGARPTRGVFQSDGLGELDVDLFYVAYTLPLTFGHNDGELRVFSIGYIDERGSVLKTDDRPFAVRMLDHDQIRIGTYGVDYVHVLHTQRHGQLDFFAWGAVQNGSWGKQAQSAGAFAGEIGWQPPVSFFKPWLSVGYSYGSGDSNPNDAAHGTFFQILPTPRIYARFPFYNMENNEDYYGSAAFRLPHSLAVRSEMHALRLASAQDLWYLGGGAFQPHTFGYVGRTSGGSGSLANVWDISLDCHLRYGFTLTTHFGHAWGKSVIASIYPNGTNAQFGYVETNFRF